MITRLKFACIVGILGTIIGLVVAFVIQDDGEAFPSYIVIPFTSLFALAGATAKKDWADSVLEFFYNVLP